MGARQQASTWLVAFDAPAVRRRLFGAATGSPEQEALVAAARALVDEAIRAVAASSSGARVERCDAVADGDNVVPVEAWSPALLAWRDGQLSRDAAVDGVRRVLADHVNHNTKAA